jgi:hypothetical protein
MIPQLCPLRRLFHLPCGGPVVAPPPPSRGSKPQTSTKIKDDFPSPPRPLYTGLEKDTPPPYVSGCSRRGDIRDLPRFSGHSKGYIIK